MTDDEMRARLADGLWRIDTGGDSPPLAQASPSTPTPVDQPTTCDCGQVRRFPAPSRSEPKK